MQLPSWMLLHQEPRWAWALVLSKESVEAACLGAALIYWRIFPPAFSRRWAECASGCSWVWSSRFLFWRFAGQEECCSFRRHIPYHSWKSGHSAARPSIDASNCSWSFSFLELARGKSSKSIIDKKVGYKKACKDFYEYFFCFFMKFLFFDEISVFFDVRQSS